MTRDSGRPSNKQADQKPESPAANSLWSQNTDPRCDPLERRHNPRTNTISLSRSLYCLQIFFRKTNEAARERVEARPMNILSTRTQRTNSDPLTVFALLQLGRHLLGRRTSRWGGRRYLGNWRLFDDRCRRRFGGGRLVFRGSGSRVLLGLVASEFGGFLGEGQVLGGGVLLRSTAAVLRSFVLALLVLVTVLLRLLLLLWFPE